MAGLFAGGLHRKLTELVPRFLSVPSLIRHNSKAANKSLVVQLKHDYPGLGTAGDFAAVRPGFARNFLVPRGVGRLLDFKEKKAWLASQEVRTHTVCAACSPDTNLSMSMIKWTRTLYTDLTEIVTYDFNWSFQFITVAAVCWRLDFIRETKIPDTIAVASLFSIVILPLWLSPNIIPNALVLIDRLVCVRWEPSICKRFSSFSGFSPLNTKLEGDLVVHVCDFIHTGPWRNFMNLDLLPDRDIFTPLSAIALVIDYLAQPLVLKVCRHKWLHMYVDQLLLMLFFVGFGRRRWGIRRPKQCLQMHRSAPLSPTFHK